MKTKLSRRVLFLAMSLLMALLSACSGGGTLQGTMDAIPLSAESNEKPVSNTYSVAHPYTREMLEAIPVANASMSSDQLRDICLAVAKMQATIPWVTSQRIR